MLKNNNNKILFVKQGSLGDVLLTTPAIRIVKNNFPEATIDYLSSKSCAKLIEGNPEINNAFVMEELNTSKNPFLEIFKILKLAWFILKHNDYDIVFVFHRSIVLFFVFRLLMKGRVYASSKKNFNLRKHRILRSLDMIRLAFDIKYSEDDFKLIYNCPKNAVEPLAVSPPYVVIAPGGGGNAWSEMPNRRWPLENYLELAKLLIRELKLRVVIIGDEGEKFIFPQASETEMINLIGKTSIPQLAALLKAAALFIGNDSFPLFLSAAVGIKTVGIFGPTDSKLINPFGKNHFYIQSKAACSPCYSPIEGLKGKAYLCRGNACMRDIPANQVFDLASSILNVTINRHLV